MRPRSIARHHALAQACALQQFSEKWIAGRRCRASTPIDQQEAILLGQPAQSGHALVGHRRRLPREAQYSHAPTCLQSVDNKPIRNHECECGLDPGACSAISHTDVLSVDSERLRNIIRRQRHCNRNFRHLANMMMLLSASLMKVTSTFLLNQRIVVSALSSLTADHVDSGRSPQSRDVTGSGGLRNLARMVPKSVFMTSQGLSCVCPGKRWARTRADSSRSRGIACAR